MTKKNFNYTASMHEIEQILERFRTEEMDVDQLAEEVKRASKLIQACRERLLKAEQEIAKTLGEA